MNREREGAKWGGGRRLNGERGRRGGGRRGSGIVGEGKAPRSSLHMNTGNPQLC